MDKAQAEACVNAASFVIGLVSGPGGDLSDLVKVALSPMGCAVVVESEICGDPEVLGDPMEVRAWVAKQMEACALSNFDSALDMATL